MKNIIWLIVGLFICTNILTYFIVEDLENEEKVYKSKIGEQCIVDKDTLSIIDYSFIMKTFTLSNGKSVDISFVLNSSKKK